MKKTSLKRAFILNIIGLLGMFVLFCLQYEMNKPHIREILWMIFLGEGAYWATVLLGLFACKKLRS